MQRNIVKLAAILALCAMLLSSCGGEPATTEGTTAGTAEITGAESGGEKLKAFDEKFAAVNLQDASAVAECLALYDALSAADKAAVGYADFEKLTKAEYEAVHAEKLTEAEANRQDVITAVAKAYYDQSYRTRTDAQATPQFYYDQYNSRYNYMVAPEEATEQNRLYIACSAYVSSIYYYAFGLSLLSGKSISTSNLNKDFAEKTADKDGEVMFYITGSELSELKADPAKAAAKIDEIRAALQPGDIINYVRSTGSGHAILFFGNGKFIHSTGSSNAKTSGGDVDPKTSVEKGTSDENRFGTVNIDDWGIFFTDTMTPKAQNDGRSSTTNSYIFADNVTAVAVVRPLSEKDGRMKGKKLTDGAVAHYLYPGIDIEKTAKRGTEVLWNGNSVFAGDKITYTVTVRNNSDAEMKALTLTETLPIQMEYISSSDGSVYFEKEGIVAQHAASLGAGQTLEFTYTLQVKAGIAGGRPVSDTLTYVNGIKTNPMIFQAAVTRLDAAKMKTAVGSTVGEKYEDGIAAAKAVYAKLGTAGFTGLTEQKKPKDVIETLLASNALQSSSRYGGMVVRTLYGGYKVGSAELSAATKNADFDSINNRARRVMMPSLETGDIIVTYSECLKSHSAVLYAGEELYGILSDGTFGKLNPENLSAGTNKSVQDYLDTLTAYNAFLVLRPALTD